ncbi:highly acidic protein [Campylobacter sp. B0100352/1]|nr:highly acidic protein [Campylobacter sp. B0100352/1]MBZ7964722.1 highly acidic protein [Campylobacter sp. 2457A]
MMENEEENLDYDVYEEDEEYTHANHRSYNYDDDDYVYDDESDDDEFYEMD